MGHTIEIGDFHELKIVRLIDRGVMLGAGDRELFLPSHMVPRDAKVDDAIEVFIYADHDGSPQATTKQPAALVDEIAHLKCVSVTGSGAFLEWGIPKDLYVPPDQQTTRMVEGRSYVVAIILDKKGERLMGSAHLAKHFNYDIDNVEVDDEVDLLVHGHSEAGVQVVVNRCYRGLIHNNEVHQRLDVGEELEGFVRKVRPDNRLDITLIRRGVEGIADAQTIILDALKEAGGSLAFHDKSPPAEIQRAFGLSKKAFKRGLGALYKARSIVIEGGGFRLAALDGDET